MKKKKTLKQKYKSLQKAYYLNFAFFLLVAGISVYLSLTTVTLPDRIDNVPEIHYSTDELRKTARIIAQVDDKYLAYVKEITVIESFEEYCKDNLCTGECREFPEFCLGLNRGYDKVIVVYYDDEQFRWTLCHELLHSIILMDDSNDHNRHQIVDELAKRGVCF